MVCVHTEVNIQICIIYTVKFNECSTFYIVNTHNIKNKEQNFSYVYQKVQYNKNLEYFKDQSDHNCTKNQVNNNDSQTFLSTYYQWKTLLV